jgi:vacuolar-type H+-ATPase subunit I/STV1
MMTSQVPCAALSALIVLFKLHVHTPKTPFWEGFKRIDWLGSVVMITGAVILLLGLQMGGVEYAWTSPIILCFMIFGASLIATFVVVEWKVSKYPLMPLRVLSNRTSISALGVCCFHSMCLVGGA